MYLCEMLCCHELDDGVHFVSILVEMTSFRVTIVCFWNGSIRTRDNNVTFVGGKRKLFAYKSNIDLNEFKLLVCSKIGINHKKYCKYMF